ncbi:2-hydroxyacyl-CoA dehydratase family protein [Streptomyces olivaceus]|uniref:2-hydroxyacyl-CoA dehydratase family protein n=1 Tax=Streptomyces TaxID=1883 RepID=UPI0018A7FEB0|nr:MULTISPECIES: 2-hydroxyacyl-CoA dehydratase family protein [Streptomyces]MBF8170640.1 2-hydroxyacyl-CoA dehydratase [Streptomyces olivaceus]MBZ6259651.1 2-hydroxyacyl-CoA dehydratase family protein [Streptomyces olivaceus]MCM8550149.1 2-hydroxyacyl-CoA dehydratase family protein [Streptomyces sp. STCH 565 A]WFB82002.1 2-hydroxyacyl-CoA dehydratase family protein [Streptomyces olivaceus]WGK44336.1 2-hydroxyacyl-CoA dehydratase family protein [Streptomyces sp. B146]
MSAARLASASAATAHQRQWFADLHQEVADGGDLALVNADAPQEIFRAMGIPYVVNQWWSSIVTAKRRAQDYLGLLRERGYPDDSEQYSSIPLASAFDPDPANAPWGGLPRPTIVLAETTGDASRKIFDIWDTQPGVSFYPLESAAENEVPARWWELMPRDWERAVGSDRLDLMTGELEGLIRFLEQTTGRVFSETRFAEVMNLVNEQQEWNRRTRDLIARARPCPLPVNDSIPSVMIPQWHRGTTWARDAARAFHDEVAERVSTGAAVCPGERARLMWIGRGLWFDLDFYRRFEQSHGAVFVWSMYLAIAADGYLRYGGDPLRALAARFAAFSDQLYTPPWSAEWYVKEARHHGVDGVVHLVSEDARGSYFTTRALEAAGIPVLELHADNVDARSADGDALTRTVGDWLDRRVRAGD